MGQNTAAIRIARLITRLNIGGPSIQAIDLSRELRARHFETCLIHGRLSPGEGDMTKLRPVGDLNVVYVDELSRPISLWRDARAFWKIYRALCRWKPDIVHTHMAKAGTLGRLAGILYNRTHGKAQRARLIHTYHGHVFEGYFGTMTTRAFLLVERWLGKRSHSLIAISNRVKQDLLFTYAIGRPDQIRLIPLGFDLDRLLKITTSQRSIARTVLGVSAEHIVVTTVGRLSEIKEQRLFLEMAARLVNLSPRYLFLVVGDGELRADLERQTAALRLEPHTRFLGWRGDLETVYGATDVFVLTSRNEGTPVALIEAMASALACVSTDVGGVRDVVDSDSLGTLVPFGDALALSAAVHELAVSPGLRESMGHMARASVAGRYHRNRLLEDISALYRTPANPG